MQRKSVPWRGTIPKKEYTSNFVDPEQRLLVIHEEPKTWDNSKMKILIQQEKRKMIYTLLIWYSTLASSIFRVDSN